MLPRSQKIASPIFASVAWPATIVQVGRPPSPRQFALLERRAVGIPAVTGLPVRIPVPVPTQPQLLVVPGEAIPPGDGRGAQPLPSGVELVRTGIPRLDEGGK